MLFSYLKVLFWPVNFVNLVNKLYFTFQTLQDHENGFQLLAFGSS